MNPEVLFVHARFDLPGGAIETVKDFALVPATRVVPEADPDVYVPAVLFNGEWLLLLEAGPDDAVSGVFVPPHDWAVLILDDGEHQHPVHLTANPVDAVPSDAGMVARALKLTGFEILGVQHAPACVVIDRTGVRHVVYEDLTVEVVDGLDGDAGLWFAPVATSGVVSIVPSFDLSNPDQAIFMLRFSVGQAVSIADMLCEQGAQGAQSWAAQFAAIAAR